MVSEVPSEARNATEPQIQYCCNFPSNALLLSQTPSFYMKLLTCLVLIITLAFSACDNACVQETNEEGNRKIIKSFPNCSDTGSYTLQVTLNDKTFLTGQYKAGKEEGEFNQYDTASNTMSVVNIYANGILEQKSEFNGGILYWKHSYESPGKEKCIAYFP